MNDTEKATAASEKELIRAVAGEIKELPALTALKQLLREPTKRTRDVVGSLLEDASRPADLRLVAALALGSEDTKENRELLIRSLEIDDPHVLGGVLQSLGKIGDERALAALPSKGKVAKAAREDLVFARRLIAYRHRVDTELFPSPRKEEILKVSKKRSVKMKSASITPAKLKKLRHLNRELPALRQSLEGALRLTCREQEFLLNSPLAQPSAIWLTWARPWFSHRTCSS